MFDPDTSALIGTVPDLPGLEKEALAKSLSKAFAQISAARIRLRTIEEAEADDVLVEVIDEMRRLAMANEAFVTVDIEREDRAAAAFVAGTAYQLWFNAEALQERPIAPSRLSARDVSPEIATVLLFLIAEATADASEASEHLFVDSTDPIERAILNSIRSLARGRLEDILEIEIPGLDHLDGADLADLAVASIYRQLLVGLRTLALRLAGQATEANPRDLFISLRDLCLSDQHDVFADGQPEYVSGFPGPFHLATLLAALSDDLLDSSAVNIPCPNGLDPDSWADSLKKVAIERPFLWRNHREAIAAGYLEIGVSSVVGFPTGAGKSTLSELKINVALLNGKTVVFLAPTLALVDQTALSLAKSFPNAQIDREKSDPFLANLEEDAVEILVLTPEACLAQMSFDKEAFANVGLIVFDECHLLHPSDRPEDRRPIDAMLCLLNLIRLADETDVLLLSAMVQNTDELAGWLNELTGKSCLPLSLSWKPTRQIRGCVVYDDNDIKAIQSDLVPKRAAATTKGVPTAVKKSIGAAPYGFFSLHQTWATKKANDYSLQKLLEDEILLGINGYWRLTPNAGEISSAIAAKSSQMGVKTLVFFQTIKNANSAAKKVAKLLPNDPIQLTSTEQTLFNAAVLEFGASNCLYLNVEDDCVSEQASIHHGLLLPEERRLVESLYKRSDGISVLCATSTLAQGMNLPSEMVVIAEDSRFNEAANRREVLEAQDLLNAAGRAGRAGMNANGMVLVVPGKVVPINMEKMTIGNHWTTLLAIFGQSDQCLEIDDPLTAVMDRIHAGIEPGDEEARYCITRLSLIQDEADEAALARVIRSTLSGYRARKKKDEQWIEDRVSAVMRYAEEAGLFAASEITPDQNIAALFGFPISVIQSLREFLDAIGSDKHFTILEWCDALFDWLAGDRAAFQACFRHENLARLFGSHYEALKLDAQRDYAVPKLQAFTRLWLEGAPLIEIEERHQQKAVKANKCLAARRFVLRCIPDISYSFSLPMKVLEQDASQSATSWEPPAPLECLSRCIREGFSSPELLALRNASENKSLSRCQIYQQYQNIAPHLTVSEPQETFDTVSNRVEIALLLS